MNKRIYIWLIVALVALLPIASVYAEAASAGQFGQAQKQGAPSQNALTGMVGNPDYAVQPATIAGGAYRIATGGVAGPAPVMAAGGNYRLGRVIPQVGSGTPCCCTFLPCTLKSP
jgi:hypothetical protein